MSISIDIFADEGVRLISFYPENNMSLRFEIAGASFTIYGLPVRDAFAMYDHLKAPGIRICRSYGSSIWLGEYDAEMEAYLARFRPAVAPAAANVEAA